MKDTSQTRKERRNMIKKLLEFEKEILENYERYELLNNGYEIPGCECGMLFADRETNTYIELGYNANDVICYVMLKNEL